LNSFDNQQKWSENQVRKPVVKAFQNGYIEYPGWFSKQKSAKINSVFVVTKRFITKNLRGFPHRLYYFCLFFLN